LRSHCRLRCGFEIHCHRHYRNSFSPAYFVPRKCNTSLRWWGEVRCSSRYIPCQVPRVIFPAITGTVRLVAVRAEFDLRGRPRLSACMSAFGKGVPCQTWTFGSCSLRSFLLYNTTAKWIFVHRCTNFMMTLLIARQHKIAGPVLMNEEETILWSFTAIAVILFARLKNITTRR